MSGKLTELLKKMCELPGPPGQEQAVRNFIADEIKPFCRELREDPLGNLIAEAGAEDGYKVGVLAHMDEVGFIVSSISDRGLIGFELMGNIDARCLLNCEVDLISRDGTLIRGVIGNLSRHLQTEEESQERIPTTIHKVQAPMQPVSVSYERDKLDGSSSVSMRQGK
jgi:putative aminopeptidase FrvX